MEVRDLPQSWWFDRHSSIRQSPWLLSTLSELEDKTKQMLKLIEEDADSFAQRAEMYYKKRPQLVNMIEHFYRAYRSLAEQYDLLKLGVGIRRGTSSIRSSVDKSCSQKVTNSTMDDESSVLSLEFLDSEDSEVDDPEQEEAEAEGKLKEVADKKSDNDVMKHMREELARLKLENATLKAELAAKDEEKREVIRQLALPLDILKEENTMLRKCIKNPKKSSSHFEFKKLTEEIFSGRLFADLLKGHPTIVAL